jgi:imidazolonepropionase-like amidohydrolase
MVNSMKRLSILLALIILQINSICIHSQSVTILIGGTLIDGTGSSPLMNAVVILEGSKITNVGTLKTIKIPNGARIIDVKNKFILPGLIDTHLHLELAGLSDVGELPKSYETTEELWKLVIINARLNLMSGFTTVRDLGSTGLVFKLRDEINSNKIVGPTIIAAGMQLVKKDSSAYMDNSFLEYDGIEDARSKVIYLKKLGAEVIKIRLTKSRVIPSLQEVETIVNEAHKNGLKATVHTDVPADELVQLAIDAKADGIEHNAPLRSKKDSVLLQMKNNGMSLMAGGGHFFIQRIDTTCIIDSLDLPQLKCFNKEILDSLHSGIDSLHRQTKIMKKNGWSASQRQKSFTDEIMRARKSGVLLVFGTDCGASGMIHGEQYKALHGESQMGSSTMEAILMATRDAAIAIDRNKNIGTVKAGKDADLIVVNENPLLDLRNLKKLFYVIKKGIVYNPADLKIIE